MKNDHSAAMKEKMNECIEEYKAFEGVARGVCMRLNKSCKSSSLHSRCVCVREMEICDCGCGRSVS